MIEYYVSLHGTENVLLLTFENFAQDGVDFVQIIANFSGNGRFSASTLDFSVEAGGDSEALCFLLRRLNHFRADAAHPEPVVNLGRFVSFAYKSVSFAGRRAAWLKSMRPIRDEIRQTLAFDYAPSNAITRTLVRRPEFMARYAS